MVLPIEWRTTRVDRDGVRSTCTVNASAIGFVAVLVRCMYIFIFATWPQHVHNVNMSGRQRQEDKCQVKIVVLRLLLKTHGPFPSPANLANLMRAVDVRTGPLRNTPPNTRAGHCRAAIGQFIAAATGAHPRSNYTGNKRRAFSRVHSTRTRLPYSA